MKNPLIIGAGGVASYLLPCLIKAFRPSKVTIIDKDILEERNLDRQMFSHSDIGRYKAEALVSVQPYDGQHFKVITEWFTPTTEIDEDVDAIICVADNHEARRNAIRAAYERNIRCYIGGNEYFDAEAYVTWADHDGTKLDPRVRYPLIATSHEGSPLRCQGEEQEAHPQLAIANFRCAGHIMHLIHLWERFLPEIAFKDRAAIAQNLPIETVSSMFETFTKNSSELSR